MKNINSIKMNCGSNVSKKRKNIHQDNFVRDVLNDYCASSSIHGIGYIGAKDKNLAEKIWWIIVVILSVICCCYLISKTWIKWQTSPVILSFEQEQTPIWKIPFPAITICPLNKVQQTTYNYTEMFLKRDELEGEEYKKFWDISLTCNLEEYGISFNSSINITDNYALENIRSVESALQESFAEIKWKGKTYELEKIADHFSEQITQEGICFTFNSFSQDDMFTEELDHDIVYINQTTKKSDWNLETGYLPDSSVFNNYPRRTANDGYGSGLTIGLYHVTENTDYVCGPMISGYKVLLHNPAELPKPKDQYFLIPLNKKITFTVKPELTTTSENLRFMSLSARKCYFSNEKSLRFFRVYTESNCRTECVVNVTKHICGCVPFYMPHAKETPICGFGRMDCVFETEVQMNDFEMIEKGANASSETRHTQAYKIYDRCNCLPSCSNLQFSAETSHTDLHAVQSSLAGKFFNESNEEEVKIVKILESGILMLTQVDIFYKESQFLALHRSELYGQTDFLANCGGLLGLFMGFSLLSIIEILYFMTIRLWIKWRNTNKENTKL